MKKIFYLFFVILLFIMVGCATNRRVDKDFTYFQHGLDSIGKLQLKEPVIRPNDLLSIQVFSNSLNQEQSALYNLPNGFGPGVVTTSSGQSVIGHLVSENGDIFYPNIGQLHVQDLTVLQLKDTLQKKLADYVKKPEVLVRFLNFKINMMGEVKSPGAKIFLNQKVTILDAISAAGDLSDQGRRDNILVLREDKGEIKHYYIDLRKTDFINSPVFQLQQNDVVYVQPNDVKLKTVKRDPNVDRDLQLLLGFVGITTSVISLFYLIKR